MLRLNPIYKKELKQNSRMKKTAIMLLFYNTMLAIFGLFALYLIFNSHNKSGYPIEYSNMLKIYSIITGIEFVLVLFIIPAMTAGTIAGEREKQTLDILLTTRVSIWQIVTGKLAASISMMVLLAFSSLPIIAIVFSVGGITLLDLAEYMIFITVTAIFIGSIGLFFSALCKSTTAATVCSYMLVLLITAGLALLLIGSNLIQGGSIKTFLTSSTYASLQMNGDDFKRFGDSILLLLINPIFTFLSLTYRQTGLGSDMETIWTTGNQVRFYVASHWFEVSLLIQLVISLGLLLVTKKLIKGKRDKK